MSLVQLTEAEERARDRVIFALDYPTVGEAELAAVSLGNLVGHFKIGMELHTAAGHQGSGIVNNIYQAGGGIQPNVFLDLKYHDTPQTVYGAARVAASMPGVSMFNIHIAGGEAMCKKAVNGAYEGARLSQRPTRPDVLGVTVLTSLDEADLEAQNLGITVQDLIRRRTELAKEWGLDGIVCPAKFAGALEQEFGSDFIYVTPGVKWGGLHGAGQKQLYTPDQAVKDCSCSRLVIGSAIRKAQDRRQTAYDILRAMASHV